MTTKVGKTNSIITTKSVTTTEYGEANSQQLLNKARKNSLATIAV